MIRKSLALRFVFRHTFNQLKTLQVLFWSTIMAKCKEGRRMYKPVQERHTHTHTGNRGCPGRSSRSHAHTHSLLEELTKCGRHCWSGQTCWKGRVWACLRSRCCCCCCRSFICINCCCDVMACREGGCIMAPERRCSMLDRACLVLVGTKEPAASNREPPTRASSRKGFLHTPCNSSWFDQTQASHRLRLLLAAHWEAEHRPTLCESERPVMHCINSRQRGGRRPVNGTIQVTSQRAHFALWSATPEVQNPWHNFRIMRVFVYEAPKNMSCYAVLSHFSRGWLCDPMDCSPRGSSVHGILQARILEWAAMPSSRGSSRLRDWTHVSYIYCTGRQVLYH